MLVKEVKINLSEQRNIVQKVKTSYDVRFSYMVHLSVYRS